MCTWTSTQGGGSLQSSQRNGAQSRGAAGEHNGFVGCPCWAKKLWSSLGRAPFVLVTHT